MSSYMHAGKRVGAKEALLIKTPFIHLKKNVIKIVFLLQANVNMRCKPIKALKILKLCFPYSYDLCVNIIVHV